MDYEPSFVPHPSYQLEDSSDESDCDQDQVSTRKTTRLAPEPRVQLEGGSDTLERGGQVVFLVGEAGERMAQGVQLDDDSQLIQVSIDGQQCGAILPRSEQRRSTLVFLSTSLPLSHLHPLASYLFETLAPSSSVILASYHLPSYIPPSTTESQTSFSSRLPILFLSSPSFSDPLLASLRENKTIEPYLPPNLLHGLPSSLLIVSSLAPSASTHLFLLPTSTPPQPLNGPFSHLSPVTQPNSTTLYDAGGPIASSPSAQFRQLSLDKLSKLKQAFGWDWWTPSTTTLSASSASGSRREIVAGKGFEWLERQRKSKKKEETSSMFM